jgi:hypothetical protein
MNKLDIRNESEIWTQPDKVSITAPLAASSGAD